MPELPEVEVLRRGLERRLVGARLRSVTVVAHRRLDGDPRTPVGQTVSAVWRRGKVLGIDFSDGTGYLIHLGMSGQLRYVDAERGLPEHDRHTVAVWTFTGVRDGGVGALWYRDARRFGWLHVVTADRSADRVLRRLASLGPEPLNAAFSPELLAIALARHPRRPVKNTLLDQKAVAGIGNIYASEACFRAGIDPRRPGRSLGPDEVARLHQAIVAVLRDGIRCGGATRATFHDLDGRHGTFLDHAAVYCRDGQPCPRCGTAILREILAGRSTYRCPRCQR